MLLLLLSEQSIKKLMILLIEDISRDHFTIKAKRSGHKQWVFVSGIVVLQIKEESYAYLALP